MKTSRSALAALLFTCVLSSPSHAQRREFGIAAGPLAPAITEIARQAGIDIGVTDPAIAMARTAGVRGKLSTRAALDRLLAGSGYRAEPIDGSAYRIVRDTRPKAGPPKPAPLESAASKAEDDIIVTAGKHDGPLLRFPGSIAILQSDGMNGFGTDDKRDMHMIAAGQSILQTTSLGDGRNKLFIRGIADSSFAGPTRSTANVYLGEVQLGYNGADPNLNLYDISRVEVLEGPQGALYGAGSIGGIIRLTPNAPTATRFAVSGMSMAGTSKDGDNSYAIAGMVNIPLTDKAALRVVGFLTHDGGFINDQLRRLTNINRTRTRGGRATLRLTPGDGWTIDVGGVAQSTSAPDSQYTQLGAPHLTRSSTIAQPFEGDFQLIQGVITKDWESGLRLVSATGFVEHHSDDRFDAKSLARPGTLLAYDTHDRNRLFTQEARLSRSVANGNSWLMGVSYIADRDAIQRELGMPGFPQDIAGVTNRAKDLSGFGEATIAVLPMLSFTAGGRLTYARTASDPAFTRTPSSAFISGRTSVRLSPMLATNAVIAPHFSAFARYGSGFRTGGLAVAAGIGRVANFTPDAIRVIEAGVRLQRAGAKGFAGSIGLSQARWAHIQADLVDRRGFPYTTNIGNGRIEGIEASADWIPLAGLKLDGAMFFNRSRLLDPIGGLARQRGNALPDTPRFAANAAVAYHWPIGELSKLNVSATARYRGHSFVGYGTMLNVTQGGYAVMDVAAGWRRNGIGVSLALDNIANRDGNVFALGNPFSMADRDQRTPLRPRTLRLTLSFDR